MKTETKTSLEAKVDLLLGLVHDLRQQASNETPSPKQWLSQILLIDLGDNCCSPGDSGFNCFAQQCCKNNLMQSGIS